MTPSSYVQNVSLNPFLKVKGLFYPALSDFKKEERFSKGSQASSMFLGNSIM
jgi:hypothetical protein